MGRDVYNKGRNRGKEVDAMEYATLNNGVKMPRLGYGVYQVGKEE